MRIRMLLIMAIILVGQAWSYQSVGTDSTVDILTWNLRDFPQSGNQTVTEVAKIIADLNVDLIAVQEIASVSAFEDLKTALPDWDGILSSHTYFDGTYHKVGILYKKNVVTVHNHQLIFENYSYDFPRPPMEINLTLNENNRIFDFNLIVLHLKAYSDATSEARRRSAIQRLKEYVDHQVDYTMERDFIVLGDFNDQLEDPQPTPNVFTPILQDPDDYSFLTLPLAGFSASYIFGKTPSLIDHILITKDAFEEYGNAGVTNVLFLDASLASYTDIISDHRPVLAQFAFNNKPAPTNIVPLSEIQNNFPEMEGQIVTVRGVVTIGAGRLNPSYTSVYIQDQSGAGINIFKYGAVIEDFARSSLVEVTGDLYNYNGLHEIRYHSHQKISEDQPLPVPKKITTAEIVQTAGQGQLIEIIGQIESKTENSGNVTLNINDGTGAGKIYADVDAKLDLTSFKNNDTVRVAGVKSVYANEGEILLAYPEDISHYSATSVENSVRIELPEKFELLGNFPNPFNAGTVIKYSLAQPARISIKIFNMQGQEISNLVREQQSAGTHSVSWNALNLPSGLYILHFQANQQILTHKMMLLK